MKFLIDNALSPLVTVSFSPSPKDSEVACEVYSRVHPSSFRVMDVPSEKRSVTLPSSWLSVEPPKSRSDKIPICSHLSIDWMMCLMV